MEWIIFFLELGENIPNSNTLTITTYPPPSTITETRTNKKEKFTYIYTVLYQSQPTDSDATGKECLDTHVGAHYFW